MNRSVTTLALVLWTLTSPVVAAPDALDGDVIFQTSRSRQSEAIRVATRSPFSHVGVVVHRRGEAEVFEASGRAQFTPLTEWIESGEQGHYVLMRLRDRAAVMTPGALARFAHAIRAMVGRPYDTQFLWSDEKLYCSELVWKLYRTALGVTLAEPRRLGSYNLEHPKVKPLVRQRYGAHVPVDEPAVAPGDLAESPLLVEVERR